MTVLADPDFWNKPTSFGWVGLAVGCAIGTALGFYFFPPRKYSYYGGQLRLMLIWLPCTLLGIFIGQLISHWTGR